MLLKIRNLFAKVDGKEVLRGIDLDIAQGEIHVMMGPNGIGKSTLAHVLMGKKAYTVESGSIEVDGEDITGLNVAERARKGLFLGFQYPVAVPGLKVSEYLRSLYNVTHNKQIGVAEFRRFLKDKLEMLDMDRSILSRYLNDGLSGGEMKRLEMLQLAVVKPKLAILDEIDSGVDVDAQKTIGEAIKKIAANDKTSFLIISHYQRLPKMVEPTRIHVVLEGKITRSGDLSLVDALEREGYDWMRTQPRVAAGSDSING